MWTSDHSWPHTIPLAYTILFFVGGGVSKSVLSGGSTFLKVDRWGVGEKMLS